MTDRDNVILFPNRTGHEPELPIMLAAHEFNRSVRTLERWVADGCPHTRTEAGHLRFRASKVRAWQLGREDGDAA